MIKSEIRQKPFKDDSHNMKRGNLDFFYWNPDRKTGRQDEKNNT